MTLNRKITISIASSLILSILFVIFVVFPLFSEIKEIPQVLSSQRQKLVELEEKVKDLDKFKKILPEISLNLEKIDHFFIDPEVPVDFIRFLEKIAQDSKVSLKISPASLPQTVNADSWSSILFHLSLAGPFHNLSNFLEKLESSPYLIEVHGLNIVSELRPSEFEQFSLGNVKVNLSIKVYTK